MSTNSGSQKRFVVRSLSLLVVFAFALFFTASLEVFGAPQFDHPMFQSPLPDRDDSRGAPPSWAWSDEEDVQQFGAVTVKLPPGFTDQGGANVFCDVLVTPLLISNQKLIPGTEIALGIWPPNDQVDFQKPIEIRLTLDPAKVIEGAEDRLIVMMYNPATDQWEELPSKFQPGTFQITTAVQSFKPVPKDFPNWGGRTFFGVFERSGISEQTPASTPVERATSTCPPTPEGWVTYRVKSGDTLYSLAMHRDTTVDAIMDANCLHTADTIITGQVLLLPPLPSATVTSPPISPTPTPTAIQSATQPVPGTEQVQALLPTASPTTPLTPMRSPTSSPPTTPTLAPTSTPQSGSGTLCGTIGLGMGIVLLAGVFQVRTWVPPREKST